METNSLPGTAFASEECCPSPDRDRTRVSTLIPEEAWGVSPNTTGLAATTPQVRVPFVTGKGVLRIKTGTTLAAITYPGNIKIGEWMLLSTLVIQLRRTRREAIATIWLEGIHEYGVGKNDNEAIEDLIESLGEHRESLERREDALAEISVKQLVCLRQLIKRSA